MEQRGWAAEGNASSSPFFLPDPQGAPEFMEARSRGLQENSLWGYTPAENRQEEKGKLGWRPRDWLLGFMTTGGHLTHTIQGCHPDMHMSQVFSSVTSLQDLRPQGGSKCRALDSV